MTDKENTIGLYASLAKAQAEFPVIEKNKTADAGKFKYSYADLADILKVILPILSSNDLCLTQHTSVVDKTIMLTTRVTHVFGDSIEGVYPVCSINGAHQQMGGALTYARRYGLSSLLAIATDDDVDGQGAETVKEHPNNKPQNQPAKDEKTVDQKINDLVNWLPDCIDMAKFQTAENRAKDQLKPHMSEQDWVRLEAELNATFDRITSRLEAKEAA